MAGLFSSPPPPPPPECTRTHARTHAHTHATHTDANAHAHSSSFVRERTLGMQAIRRRSKSESGPFHSSLQAILASAEIREKIPPTTWPDLFFPAMVTSENMKTFSNWNLSPSLVSLVINNAIITRSGQICPRMNIHRFFLPSTRSIVVYVKMWNTF